MKPSQVLKELRACFPQSDWRAVKSTTFVTYYRRGKSCCKGSTWQRAYDSDSKALLACKTVRQLSKAVAR